MDDDPESPLEDLGDDLVLSRDEEAGEVVLPRKPISIPERTKSSGMVRRQVSVSDLKREVPEPFSAPGGPRKAAEGRDEPSPGSGAEEVVREEKREDSKQEEQDGSRQEAVLDRSVVRNVGDRPPPGAAAKPIEAREIGAGDGAVGAAGVRVEPPLPAPRRRVGAPEGEEAWTGNRSSLWFVLAGLVCIAVITYFVVANFKKASPAPKPEAPKRAKLSESFAEIPIAEFVSRSAELLPIVSDILVRVVDAEGPDLVRLIRGGAESAARLKAWRARKSTPARHLPITSRQLHAAAVGGTGYLVLTGLDAEYLVATAYFVKVGEEFKYDWEASEGYSEVLPSEVETIGDNEPKLMRVVVSVSDFYTPQFSEDEYRCYSFHHQDPGVFVWAFAKRNSLVDRSLKASFVSPDLKGTEQRATVKVRKGPPGARANQLEVVEFLHTDWLTP